jgi:hypothetical protein
MVKTHRVSPEVHAVLTALWREVHDAQAAYVTAQLRADQLAIPFPLNENTVAIAKDTETRRHQVRDELRHLYGQLVGNKGVCRVNAYFAALDNMYTRSHRYTFVSKTGATYPAAKLQRERAAANVNKMTQRPPVLTI